MEESLKTTRKHFSKLGGMFILGTIAIYIVQFGMGIRLDPGLVGLPLGLRLGDGDVAVGLGLGDGGVLLDEAGVVRAQVLDEPVLVGDVLDVAGQDFDAQLIHILAGLGHHLVGEGIPVGVDLLEGQGADDLTHIALEGVLQIAGDIVGALVQEVFGGQLDALGVGGDTDLGHGVHVDVDEVAGGDGLLCLDVDGHLAQVQLIHALQEGDADPGPADEHLALLLHAGNDVRLVGRGLDIAHHHNDEHHNDTHNDRPRVQNEVKHEDSSFQI